MEDKEPGAKYFWRCQELQHENKRLRQDIERIKNTLNYLLRDIEETQTVTTSGQFALFHIEEDGGYTCVGTGNPDKDEISEDIMDKTDLIIPIPLHTTVKEFEGF